jgi:cytochrome c
MKVSLIASALAILTNVVPGAAFGAGDADAGGRLSRERCSGCHTVDAVGPGTDAAPPFSRIAKNWGQDRSWLRTWLTNPHPQMPEMNLSPTEIENIIAYLGTLRKD